MFNIWQFQVFKNKQTCLTSDENTESLCLCENVTVRQNYNNLEIETKWNQSYKKQSFGFYCESMLKTFQMRWPAKPKKMPIKHYRYIYGSTSSRASWTARYNDVQKINHNGIINSILQRCPTLSGHHKNHTRYLDCNMDCVNVKTQCCIITQC